MSYGVEVKRCRPAILLSSQNLRFPRVFIRNWMNAELFQNKGLLLDIHPADLIYDGDDLVLPVGFIFSRTIVSRLTIVPQNSGV